MMMSQENETIGKIQARSVLAEGHMQDNTIKRRHHWAITIIIIFTIQYHITFIQTIYRDIIKHQTFLLKIKIWLNNPAIVNQLN